MSVLHIPRLISRKLVLTVMVICQIVFIIWIPFHLNVTPVQRKKTSVNNVGFLNVNKAGSSTLLNIFMRYGWRRNLTIALPRKGNIIHNDFNNLVFSPPGTKFNMLVNHVKKFERWKFEQALHWDAKYVAVVRDPLELTISAFQYYLHFTNSSIYSKIPGEDKLKEYLKHREKYDPFPNWNSYTNNRMALDFGIPVKQMRNETFIQEYLEDLYSQIDLVLVLEFFPESLVLLRRLLGWTIKDILYVTGNSNNKKEKLKFTEAELSYHRNFSLADNIIYDYFVNILEENIKAEGESFPEEVKVFKYIENKVSTYCRSSEEEAVRYGLTIEQTNFSKPIVISPEDCQIMLLPEYAFINMYRNRYITENRLKI